MTRTAWRFLFLGLTTAVVGLEVFAANDRNPNTDPWTNLIVTYIPMETAVLIGGGGIAWVVAHFAVRYARKRKAKTLMTQHLYGGEGGTWRRSSRCSDSHCLEVARGDTVRVRDSKTPDTVVEVSREDWSAFIAGAKDGEFDL